MVLRGFARREAAVLVAAVAEITAVGTVPQHDYARRVPDVGGDDQLRPGGLGDGSQRLSLRVRRPDDRLCLAPDAGIVSAPRRSVRRKPPVLPVSNPMLA